MPRTRRRPAPVGGPRGRHGPRRPARRPAPRPPCATAPSSPASGCPPPGPSPACWRSAGPSSPRRTSSCTPKAGWTAGTARAPTWPTGRPCRAVEPGSQPRAATAAATPAPSPSRRPAAAPGRVIDLRPGQPWVRDYDRAAWRRAWRRAADLPPGVDPDPYGLPRLREALADHLRRARAIPVGAENIMVTRGTGNGLDLVAATLLRPGDRAGRRGARLPRRQERLRRPGRRGRALPGRRGRRHRGRRSPTTCVSSTPRPRTSTPSAGGCPSRAGNAFSPGRAVPARSSWRTTTTPSSATTSPRCPPSTVSTPSGWCCSAAVQVPVSRRRCRLAGRRAAPARRRRPDPRRPGRPHQRPGPAGGGRTLLESGDLDRHLRRMRLEYARRRAAIVDVLGSRIMGDTAGLHVMVELPARTVGAPGRGRPRPGRAARRDDAAPPRPAARHGLVIGYGSASLAEVRRGVSVIAQLIG